MKRALGWTVLAATLVAPLWAIAGAKAASPEGKAVSNGERVYDELCSTCHGRYGRGDGPARPDLAVAPPDLTDPAVLGNRSDEVILERLTEGGGKHAMMMGTVVQPDSLRDALDFMRTLSVPGKHVSVRAGRDIYEGSCWACHGTKGDGKGPAARNLTVAPRDFTSPKFVIEGREDEIRRTISEGAAAAIHGSAYMPPWGTRLSDQQIRDVLEYIRTLKAAAKGSSGTAG